MRKNKEVYFNETLAYRNCNPLNIRYDRKTNWFGSKLKGHGGFVVFAAFSFGYRAAVMILRSYRKRGIKTMGAIIETWAPRSENNTVEYIKAVVDYMNGVFRTQYVEFTPESVIDLRDREEVKNLLMAMTKVEMGANAAQLYAMRQFIYIGYDMAVTSKDFFKGI